MSELPYYYDEKSGIRKYAEGLIPLIILVLIVVVLVGKTTNVFCTIPGFDAILCGTSGNTINIAVIGRLNATQGDTVVGASNLKDLLDGDLGRACNMQYMEYQPEDLTYVKDTLLKNYDLVVLTGERNYSRPVREAVETYLKAGGKLVLIGDAATKDPSDFLYNGWGHIKVPIQLRATGTEIPTAMLSNAQLRVVDMNHPIVVGYGFRMNLSEIDSRRVGCGAGGTAMEIVDVNPVAGGTILVISGSVDEKDRTLPAVVEQTSLMGGKVYYFSFDPGCIENMWISTVQEITGKQTCVAG